LFFCRSLQVEQKIFPLYFLWVANDRSMYCPQPRQRKIGLIYKISHFSWAYVVTNDAKNLVVGGAIPAGSQANWRRWTLRLN